MMKKSNSPAYQASQPLENIHNKGKKTVLPFEVIIMAGGKGERLKPLTEDTPKPLLPVGGKPVVQYTLDLLKEAGVRDFTFVLNYLGEKFTETFGDGKTAKVVIILSWYSSLIFEIKSVPIPDPVPPPRECVI